VTAATSLGAVERRLAMSSMRAESVIVSVLERVEIVGTE
jgi:hypothetical protein